MDNLIYFKALSDETRIRLVNILLHHEMKVGELVNLLNMGQSRISRHLKILGDAGMVESWKDGVWGYYHIVENGPARRFIDAMRYLFDEDEGLKKDLAHAAMIMEQRTSSTVRFFDAVATRWTLLKREIIGEFDINKAIFGDTGHYDVGVDLGCGTGDLLSTMKHHADRVIGVDSSPRMLEEARKRFSANNGEIEIRLGEIEHLPLRDVEADFAVISLVLQYLVTPGIAIAETARVLRPGGCFVIAEFARHDNKTLRDKYGARWLGFARQEIEKLLAENGFDVTRVDTHAIDKGLTLNVFKSTKRKR